MARCWAAPAALSRPVGEGLARFAHGLVSLAERLRHLAGEVAEALHQLTEGAAHRLLRLGVAGALLAGLVLLRLALLGLLRLRLRPLRLLVLRVARVWLRSSSWPSRWTMSCTASICWRPRWRRSAFWRSRCSPCSGRAFCSSCSSFSSSAICRLASSVRPSLQRLLQLLGHAVEVARVHLRQVGIERHLGAVAPGLLGQRLDVLLDRLAQLLHAAVDLGLVGGLRPVRVEGVAQRLPCLLEGAGGAVGAALLEREGHAPTCGSALRSTASWPRPRASRAAIARRFSMMPMALSKDVRLVGDGVERHARGRGARRG